MLPAKKPRGATAIRSEERRVQQKHLLAVGLISACLALATLITPSSDVEANKRDLPADESRLAEQTPR